MNKLFPWFGDKNKAEVRGGKTAERAEEALKQGAGAAESGDIKASTRLYEEAIGIYQALGMRRELADSQLDFARMLAADSAYSLAFEAFDAGIKIYRDLSLKPQLAEALRYSGQATAEFSSFDQSAKQLEESLKLYRSLDDAPGSAAVLLALGSSKYHQEEFDSAIGYYQQGLDLCRQLGLKVQAARSLVLMSLVAVELADYDTARQRFLESIETYLAGSASTALTDTMRDLSSTPFANHDEAAAIDLLNTALTVYAAALEAPGVNGEPANTDNWYTEASASLILAPVAYGQERFGLAVRLFERSMELARSHDEGALLQRALYRAATTARANEDLRSALKWFTELAKAAKADDSPTVEASALLGAAGVALTMRLLEEALRDCEAGLELYKSSGSLTGTSGALRLYGLLLHEQGDSETGLRVLNESLTLCRRQDDAVGAAHTLQCIGVAAKDADPALARASLDECLDSGAADEQLSAYVYLCMAELELTQGELATAYELSCKSLDVMARMRANIGAAACLECCAHVATEWGDIETAVVQLSKADSIRTAIGAPRRAAKQHQFDADAADLRAEMGDADFDKAWQEGASLSLTDLAEEAVLLLDEVEPEEEDGDGEHDEEVEIEV